MSASNVLKEFLVRIGFAVDETKFRRFQDSMDKTAKNAVEMTKTFVKLGEASLLAGSAMGASLVAAAEHMEKLYFAAQRTGASATELKTFSSAAEQVGLSAEQAQAQIEALAMARKMNPGLNGLLKTWGIDPKETDNAKVLLQVVTKLQKAPQYQAARLASNFGIDQAAYLQLRNNLPELAAAIAEREKIFKLAGVTQSEMAGKSHDFMTQVRLLIVALTALADVVAVRLIPIAMPILTVLGKLAQLFLALDGYTAGWSSRIIGLVAALFSLKGALGIIGKIGSIGKVVAKSSLAAETGEAAAGTAAGAGEAAVAGGGLLAGAGELAAGLAPVVAAIAAVAGAGYLLYKFFHSKTGEKVLEYGDQEMKKAAHAVSGFASSLVDTGMPRFFKELSSAADSLKDTIVGAIDAITGKIKDGARAVLQGAKDAYANVSGSLTGFVARMEGHAKGGYGEYRDLGGKLTVGFGHLVRAGENFSKGLDKQGALALLAADMQDAARFVHGAVKSRLNQNQTDALTDFVFNLGKGAFAHSTLLADINSGRMDDAAAQFSHWNKVLVNGHYVANQGLANRRSAEAQLFSAKPAVQLTATTHVQVDGRGDAVGTGQEVARQQTRVNADLVRNFAGAIQ